MVLVTNKRGNSRGYTVWKKKIIKCKQLDVTDVTWDVSLDDTVSVDSDVDQ